MSKEDLSLWLTVLTSIVIPFVINRYASIKIRSEYKFALIVLLSAVGGYLNFAVTGDGVAGKSWTQIVLNSAIGAIAFYNVAFRALGLEKFISPKNALVNKAKQKLQNKVSDLQTSTVKEILNPANDTTLEVNATVKQ